MEVEPFVYYRFYSDLRHPFAQTQDDGIPAFANMEDILYTWMGRRFYGSDMHFQLELKARVLAKYEPPRGRSPKNVMMHLHRRRCQYTLTLVHRDCKRSIRS